jgi:hypothetical protein
MMPSQQYSASYRPLSYVVLVLALAFKNSIHTTHILLIMVVDLYPEEQLQLLQNSIATSSIINWSRLVISNGGSGSG